MATAMEMRAMHSAHEAGMHDRKPKPEVCKICAREKKEQEATIMAKQRTQCQCGGTFDGTPSGRKAHDKTAKHKDWSATQLAQAVSDRSDREPAIAAAPLTSQEAIAAVEKINSPEPGPSADFIPDPVATIEALDNLIAETSRERDRRVTDHKWRVEHRPDEAGAYFASKVAPLQEQLAVLMAAKKLIQLNNS